jgi:hypothetical protein
MLFEILPQKVEENNVPSSKIVSVVYAQKIVVTTQLR